LAFHGAPRFTGHLDILVRPTEDNGARLLGAIAEFGFPPTALSPADIVAGTKVIEMGVPPIQIHVMSAIDGVSWDDVWTTRDIGQFGSGRAAFIGREAFLRNKRAAARPKDLADIDANIRAGLAARPAGSAATRRRRSTSSTLAIFSTRRRGSILRHEVADRTKRAAGVVRRPRPV
jgi:hypothetical protein